MTLRGTGRGRDSMWKAYPKSQEKIHVWGARCWWRHGGYIRTFPPAPQRRSRWKGGTSVRVWGKSAPPFQSCLGTIWDSLGTRTLFFKETPHRPGLQILAALELHQGETFPSIFRFLRLYWQCSSALQTKDSQFPKWFPVLHLPITGP